MINEVSMNPPLTILGEVARAAILVQQPPQRNSIVAESSDGVFKLKSVKQGHRKGSAKHFRQGLEEENKEESKYSGANRKQHAQES